MKTGMVHTLRSDGRVLYRFSGDHVEVVRDLQFEDAAPPTRCTCIVRTRKGDLAELTRYGDHWQRYADLLPENCTSLRKERS